MHLSELAAESDEEIAARVDEAGAGEVLDAVFEGMPASFQPERAAGVDAEIQWVVSGGGEEHPYVVAVRDGTCTTRAGRSESPRVTLSTDTVNFLKLIAGRANGPQLYMSGKLRLQGDMMLAQRMTTFFAPPS